LGICAVPVESRQFKVESKEETRHKDSSFNFSTFNFQLAHSSPTANFVQNGPLATHAWRRPSRSAAVAKHINEVFLSPDAFAHRTSEASIAEQLGDVLLASGLPPPAPADDDSRRRLAIDVPVA